MKRRLRWAAGFAVAGAVAWFPMTSVGTTLLLRTYDRTSAAVLPVAAYYYWRDHRTIPQVANALPLAGWAAGALALLPSALVLCWPRSQRLRRARPGEVPPPPRRALSDAHGNADWMTLADARKLFPGPHPAYGGVGFALFSEQFDTRVRMSGLAIGTQFGFALGGFAPSIAALLAGPTLAGWVPVAAFGSAAAAVATVAALTMRETYRTPLPALGKPAHV